MSQYFDLFQLPEGFALDEAELETRYRTLAARFHPDRYAAASAFEQKQAVMMSATVNEAYHTLKTPPTAPPTCSNSRASMPTRPNTPLRPEFLMQQMEWRETLAEARAEQDRAALAALSGETAAAQQELLRSLQQAFAARQYEEAAQLVRQGRFLDKLAKEISASAEAV